MHSHVNLLFKMNSDKEKKPCVNRQGKGCPKNGCPKQGTFRAVHTPL